MHTHLPCTCPHPLPLFPQELPEQKTKLTRAMNSFKKRIMSYPNVHSPTPAHTSLLLQELSEQKTKLIRAMNSVNEAIASYPHAHFPRNSHLSSRPSLLTP